MGEQRFQQQLHRRIAEFVFWKLFGRMEPYLTEQVGYMRPTVLQPPVTVCIRTSIWGGLP